MMVWNASWRAGVIWPLLLVFALLAKWHGCSRWKRTVHGDYTRHVRACSYHVTLIGDYDLPAD